MNPNERKNSDRAPDYVLCIGKKRDERELVKPSADGTARVFD